MLSALFAIHLVGVFVEPSLFTREASAQGYRNPIINADVPDNTICRAGDYYYMISTTMHLMPGAPMMRSKDLKHWETVSYVFDRIEDGDRYNLVDGKTVYGQGQWAASLRHYFGKFYAWFTTNGEPYQGFLYTADKERDHGNSSVAHPTSTTAVSSSTMTAECISSTIREKQWN